MSSVREKPVSSGPRRARVPAAERTFTDAA